MNAHEKSDTLPLTFEQLVVPEIGAWVTHADAHRLLQIIINGEPGKRRMQLCEANSPRFETIRACERHFAFACEPPITPLEAEDRAYLHQCCDALQICAYGGGGARRSMHGILTQVRSHLGMLPQSRTATAV